MSMVLVYKVQFYKSMVPCFGECVLVKIELYEREHV